MKQKRKRRFNFIQILQFSAVGGLNAVVDIVTLNVLLALWPTKHSLLLAIYNTIAYTLAVTNSYIWNARFTFKANASFRVREKFIFGFQAVTALLISNAVFLLALNGLGLITESPAPKWWEYNLSKLLSMFLSSVYSYFFMKHLIFVHIRK